MSARTLFFAGHIADCKRGLRKKGRLQASNAMSNTGEALGNSRSILLHYKLAVPISMHLSSINGYIEESRNSVQRKGMTSNMNLYNVIIRRAVGEESQIDEKWKHM